MSKKIKDWIRNSRFWPMILTHRAHAFENDYRKRRDIYAERLQERGLSYDEQTTIRQVRARTAERGYTPAVRSIGRIRTFSIIGCFTWHEALIRELEALGSVFNCDYYPYGLDNPRRKEIVSLRKQFSDFVFEGFRREHARQPFDWIFAYVNGRHILADTIHQIQEEFGTPAVNMCLDDKNDWNGYQAGSQNCGQIDIADSFDISWTSASIACDWYLAEGGRAIYMPEGCDPSQYYLWTDQYDIPISFVGASYGCRPVVIRHLRDHGIPIEVYGRGWGRIGSFAKVPAEIFSKSQINLGIGGIAFSESLTNLKSRDFDIPCTGGGVYLTSYNPDLATSFDIGKEILCYRNRDEAVEMTRYYLGRPNECREMASRARQRCLREHRWLHRYVRLLKMLGIVTESIGGAE